MIFVVVQQIWTADWYRFILRQFTEGIMEAFCNISSKNSIKCCDQCIFGHNSGHEKFEEKLLSCPKHSTNSVWLALHPANRTSSVISWKINPQRIAGFSVLSKLVCALQAAKIHLLRCFTCSSASSDTNLICFCLAESGLLKAHPHCNLNPG